MPKEKEDGPKVTGCSRGLTVAQVGANSCPAERPPLCEGCNNCFTQEVTVAGARIDVYKAQTGPIRVG